MLGFIDTDHLGEGHLLAVAQTGVGQMFRHGPHRTAQEIGPSQQDEQQRQQDKQSEQVRQHGGERGFVGRLNRDFDVVIPQVLLGRSHGRFFFDGPRLMAGLVG